MLFKGGVEPIKRAYSLGSVGLHEYTKPMTSRIAVIGTGFRPQGDTRPPDEIATIIGNDFEAELIEIPDGIFPGNPEARAMVDIQYRDAGRRALAAGFDAVYINTLGDYGLAELRDDLEIPVVGSGETVYRIAKTVGPFAVVSIWPPSLDFIRARTLEHSGTGDSFLGVTNLSEDDDMGTLGDDENFVTDMRACSLTSMQQIREARDAAIENGATVVILGCTCMAPAAAMLPPNPKAVTLDPMTLGYRFAEYCVLHNLLPQDVDYHHAREWLGN
jgi:allantoin racemase